MRLPVTVGRRIHPAFEEWTSKLGLAALVAQAYPEARAALIAQGRAAAQVDAMPTVQVAMLHTFQSYQRLRDEIFKWSGVPYHETYNNHESNFGRRPRHIQGQTNPLLKSVLDALACRQLGSRWRTCEWIDGSTPSSASRRFESSG